MGLKPEQGLSPCSLTLTTVHHWPPVYTSHESTVGFRSFMEVNCSDVRTTAWTSAMCMGSEGTNYKLVNFSSMVHFRLPYRDPLGWSPPNCETQWPPSLCTASAKSVQQLRMRCVKNRQTDSTLNIPLYNEEINCEGRMDLMECKARYTLAAKSKGRSTFGRQKSPTFDKVDWVERVQLELWRRCRPQQIGDKSAICRRFVDCRLCQQCVPGLRD